MREMLEYIPEEFDRILEEDDEGDGEDEKFENKFIKQSKYCKEMKKYAKEKIVIKCGNNSNIYAAILKRT